MRELLVALLIVGCTQAQAKDSDSGGGKKDMPTMWVSVGGGSMKVTSPGEDAVNPDGYLNFEIGGQMPVFKKLTFLQFVMGAFAGVSSGKLNYKYVSEVGTTYTASDVKYSMTNVGVRAGLQIRLIDSGWHRTFIEAGGYSDSTSVNYTKDITATPAQTLGITSEKDLAGGGYYFDAGMDLRFGRYGLRAGGRKFTGMTGKLKTADKQFIKHETTIGYLAVFKDF